MATPASPEAEAAVVGCCLMDPLKCLPEAQEVLTEEHFYDFRARMVWNAMTVMEIDKIDSVTVYENLRTKKGFPTAVQYLSECQDKAIGSSFLGNWLAILKEKHTARKLLETCDHIKSAVTANGTPMEKLLDMAESSILKVRPQQRQQDNIKELVSKAIDKFNQKWTSGDSITGLSTGLKDLDKQTDGLHPGEMIVVAAYPSCGKSALALNISTYNAIQGNASLILTAEMTAVQQVVRAICATAKVNFHELNEKSIPKINKIAGQISKAALFLRNVSGCSIGQLNAIARRVNATTPLKLVAVDYLQLIQGAGETREQQVSNTAEVCKNMAMELNCPVLVLSQLNDDGQLRESRAIGQHADSIWKIKNKGEWKPVVQPVEVHVAKCRDGSTGTVELQFEKCYTRFCDKPKIEDEDVPQ